MKFVLSILLIFVCVSLTEKSEAKSPDITDEFLQLLEMSDAALDSLLKHRVYSSIPPTVEDSLFTLSDTTTFKSNAELYKPLIFVYISFLTLCIIIFF